MKLHEDGFPVLFSEEKEEDNEVGKSFLPTQPTETIDTQPVDDFPELDITTDEPEPLDVVDEETTGSKKDEPFWHPFIRQAVGVGFESYQTIRPTDRILKRSVLITADDLYNTVNEIIPLGTESKLEEELLGDPESAVEDISSNMLSWLTSFALPGGIVAKGVTTVAKIPKIAKGKKALETFIEGGELGRKAIKATRIAAEGFLKGSVADYIRTDVDDLDTEQAIAKRFQETYEGGVYGSLLNLTGAGVLRIVKSQMNKVRALKKVRMAKEGKADPKQAVENLKKAIEEEEVIKKELEAEIDPKDKELDIAPEEPTVEPELEEFDLEFKPKVKPKVEAPVVEEPKPKLKPEEEIEQAIEGKQNFPQQVQAMVRETRKLSDRMAPKINDLVGDLNKLDDAIGTGAEVNVGKEFSNIKNKIVGIEGDLKRNRKLIDVRARVGNIAGKLLAAFRKKKVDLTNPFEYKPAILHQLNSIDSLLKLIDDVKTGKAGDVRMLDNFKKEIEFIEEVSETGDLSKALDKSFNLTVEDSLNTIWGRYQQRISEQVVKTLKVATPKNKAALDLFSNRITSTLTDAIKFNKPIAKKVKSTLDNVQDIIKNPDKYKQSIDVIINDINKAKNLDAESSKKALGILEDLKEGVNSKRFIDSLPNRSKIVEKLLKEEIDNIGNKIRNAVKFGTERQLVDEVLKDISTRVTELSASEKKVLLNTVRVELANTVSTIRDDVLGRFASKEIFQQYTLRQKIKDLDEMSDKSIEEIKEFLKVESRNIQTDPEGIKALKKQAKESRKVLTDKLKNEEITAKNLFNQEFLRAFSEMNRQGIAGAGNVELALRAIEKWRMNTGLLMSVKTYMVGIPSATIMNVVQPFQKALKEYSSIKELQKLGRMSREIKALDVALEDIKAMSLYWTMFGDAVQVFKQTFKRGGDGSFISNNLRRHEEDLVGAGEDMQSMLSNPLKLTFKNKKEIKQMYDAYGVDSLENSTRLRRFFEDLAIGEPTTKIGKVLDPLFSASFRAMGMADQPFLFLGAMRNLRAESMKKGMKLGMTGDALEKFVKEEADKAIKKDGDILTWAGHEEFEDVKELAMSITFQQDYADKWTSQLAKTFARWSRSGGKEGGILNTVYSDPYINPAKIFTRLMTSFIKTPTTIAQWTVDTFPGTAVPYWAVTRLGNTKFDIRLRNLDKHIVKLTKGLSAKPISKEIKDKLIADRASLLQQKEDLILKTIEVKAESTANTLLGLTVTAGITLPILNNQITGSGAHLTPDQKKRLIATEDWRPNTIYIGGKKIDYSKFEPFSTIISAYADGVHHLVASGDEVNEEYQSLFNTVWASFITNFKDKYFLRGVKEMFDLLDERNPTGRLETFFANLVGSFLPRPLRELGEINEEYQKYSIGFVERLKVKVGMDTQRIERNMLGEKVKRKYTNEGLYGLVSPIYVSEMKDDTVMKTIANFNEKFGYQTFYSKGNIDMRKFRNKSNDYPLFQAFADLIANKRKPTTVGRDTGQLTLRSALSKLIKSKDYKEAIQYGDPLEGEQSRPQLIKDKINEYRNHFWEVMQEDRKYKNFVNEDGDSWLSFTRKEETSKTKRRKKDVAGPVEKFVYSQ